MIRLAFYSSPFGTMRMEYEGELLYTLGVTDQIDGPNEQTDFTQLVNCQLQEYFQGTRREFQIPYQLHGTQFQLSVWHVLERIPYGGTMTYGEIAAAIERPKAARAVGQACHRNPIWLIVPCHRVIGGSGSLTGYAGGVDMKQGLLALEARTAVH